MDEKNSVNIENFVLKLYKIKLFIILTIIYG